MNTVNTDKASSDWIARVMLNTVGLPNDAAIEEEYSDEYYETTEDFIAKISDTITLFMDESDGSTLDTRSYVEPYINKVLFGE